MAENAPAVTGLDVGGAHLKVAQVAADGRVLAARQVPCALWRGMDRLDQALGEALAGLAPAAVTAATMTGELVDLFPDRAEGVRRLTERLADLAGSSGLRVWTSAGGFADSGAVLDRPLEAASANWLATATLAARRMGEGLFVDVGSTTTDIVPLAGGVPRARSLSDRERLVAEELVYLGATRTPLMAVAAEAPFAGERVPLMREHFATTADVWRVLGLLPEGADQHPAADDGPKTVEGSRRRIARMIGADLGDATPAGWAGLARALAAEQEHALLRAVGRQLSRGLVGEEAPVCAAGSGAFIVQRLASRMGRPCRSFGDLVRAEPQAAAGLDACAPAVAVALLALDGA